MATVTMTECRKRFEELFDSALAGETHTITKYGKPVAVMTAASEFRARLASNTTHTTPKPKKSRTSKAGKR